jgi:hypothetical protein
MTDYETKSGVKLGLKRKQRFKDFMLDEFNVEPAGKHPSYKVSVDPKSQ